MNGERVRSFQFGEDVEKFLETPKLVFVIEQNRDAQMRSLLMTEANVPGTKLIATLSYDGMPMTAAFVRKAVLAHLQPAKAAAAE